VRVGRQLDLLAVDRTNPRPRDRDPAGAQRDLAAGVAVTDRGAVGVVTALRADDVAYLFLHQRAQHAQADTDAQRQQPVFRSVDQLTQRGLHARRQPQLGADDLLVLYGPHGGPSRLDGLVRTRHGPSGTGRGERTATSKFYRRRDNVPRHPYSLC